MEEIDQIAKLGMRDWSLKKDYRRKKPAVMPKPMQPDKTDYLPTIKGMSSRVI